jgi:hypothetical protein
VIIEPPEAATRAMLNVLGGLLNNGVIEMLSLDGKLITELRLSNPATSNAADGELHFRKISEGIAVLSGEIGSARLVGASGSLVLLCDVGDENSDAVIKLNVTRVDRGAGVRLNSFVLRFSDIWAEGLAARRLEQPGMRSLS